MTRSSKKLKKLKLIYGDICVYCAKQISNTIDHIVPASRHGTLDLENLLPVCKPCNTKKSSMSIHEFCSKDILAQIDIYRQQAGYFRLLGYDEKSFPIRRSKNVIKTSHNLLNTLKKLTLLEYNDHTRKCIASYIASEVYLESNSKRIISLIYQKQYQMALEKIACYGKPNYSRVIPLYCNNQCEFDTRLSFLKMFFRNKVTMLKHASLLAYIY